MHEVITTEGKEVSEECLQPASPIEEIERIVQKIESFEIAGQIPKEKIVQSSEILFLEEENGLWIMDFDGASRREEERIGVWIHSMHFYLNLQLVQGKPWQQEMVPTT